MIDRTILGRYTRAFVEISVERDLLDKIEGQLAQVNEVLKQNPLLLRVLQNPLIAKDKKKAILSKALVLGDSVDSILENFFSLLIDKRREEIFPFLFDEFSFMADEKRQVVKAEVESAYSLSSKQIESLKEKLSGISGKKVIIKQKVSPDIIGGLVVTLGSKIIDASVSGQLKKLKECMLETLTC